MKMVRALLRFKDGETRIQSVPLQDNGYFMTHVTSSQGSQGTKNIDLSLVFVDKRGTPTYVESTDSLPPFPQGVA